MDADDSEDVADDDEEVGLGGWVGLVMVNDIRRGAIDDGTGGCIIIVAVVVVTIMAGGMPDGGVSVVTLTGAVVLGVVDELDAE